MQLLTPQEAATMLKVHVNTIYRWIESGELKGVKIADTWRIDQVDLEHKLSGNGNHKTSES